MGAPLISSLAFGWVAFAIIILVLLVFCFLIVRYYTDRHEAETLPTIVTTAALTLSLLALFLIPVDILNVSLGAGKDHEVKMLYYILYGCILGFAFVIIPFSYFYYEEFDEDVTAKQRIVGGCKYTIFLLLIMVVLLVIGLFVGAPKNKHDNAKDWVDVIVDTNNKGEHAIVFAIACLTIIGYLIWVSYTAYGLSAFPIGLLKGKRHLAEEASDIQSDLEATREQKRAISSRYMTGKRMSARDEKQLDLLKRQERILASRSARIDQSHKGCGKILHACKPFVFIFGILLTLVTLLIVVSVVITLIDKIANSCGVKCGFFANYPKIPNPIDLLLSNLAIVFPLDYVAFGSLIAYIFFCTLNGIVRVGVRFLWVHLYNIKARQTAPQGLLLTAIILMLALLVLNIEILTLAPRYASFGTQTYRNLNGTEVVCTASALAPNHSDPNNCTMTQIGIFVAAIEAGTPFFGNVFFYAMWLFVLTFIIGAIVTCVRRKSSNIDENDESDEEDMRA
jgi:LMBR1 domain-containing protein 1